jgi:hypothetical protein
MVTPFLQTTPPWYEQHPWQSANAIDFSMIIREIKNNKKKPIFLTMITSVFIWRQKRSPTSKAEIGQIELK